MITVAPDHPAKEDVLKSLGQDYEIVRYSSCPTDGTVSDIYLNPKGEDEHVVYPRRGISGFIENGEIREVIFTSDRPGYDSSEDCPDVVFGQEQR